MLHCYICYIFQVICKLIRQRQMPWRDQNTHSTSLACNLLKKRYNIKLWWYGVRNHHNQGELAMRRVGGPVKLSCDIIGQ